jgi:hypothetical protein
MDEGLIQIQVKSLRGWWEYPGQHYGFLLATDVFLEAIALLEDEDGGVDVLDGQRVLLMAGADDFGEVVVVVAEGGVGVNGGSGDVVGLGLRTDELLYLALLHLRQWAISLPLMVLLLLLGQ